MAACMLTEGTILSMTASEGTILSMTASEATLKCDSCLNDVVSPSVDLQR